MSVSGKGISPWYSPIAEYCSTQTAKQAAIQQATPSVYLVVSHPYASISQAEANNMIKERLALVMVLWCAEYLPKLLLQQLQMRLLIKLCIKA